MDLRRTAALAALLLLLSAADAMAGTGGAGGMPWDPWILQLRQSIGGNVALALGVIGIACGTWGWAQSGDMTGLGHYGVRTACAAGITLGGVSLLTAMAGSSGALLPPAVGGGGTTPLASLLLSALRAVLP